MFSSTAINTSSKQHRNWLSNDQRHNICLQLFHSCDENGRPKQGLFVSLSSEFGVCPRTISALWKEAYRRIKDGGILDVSRKMKGKVGKKKMSFDVNRVAALDLRYRGTMRSIAKQLGVSKTYVHRQVEQGIIRRHSNAIKPHVSENNMKKRVRFCVSMIEISSLLNEPKFIDFNNHVHIDEKWFYITKESQNYYLTPEELDPLRSCQSKRFITKVMFLCAVARPKYNEHGDVVFDGKIGMWPFCTKEPAKRGSKNRVAGTMETKAMQSVTRPTYRAYLIEKVLPAILEKWLNSRSGSVIYIQQDNARPHIQIDDDEFREVAARIGLNAHLVCQPPNSPDLNVLDLGFFRSIESLQQQERLGDIDELIGAVWKSFNEQAPKTLNYVFISLQLCMIEIMKANGAHKYKTPHINKNQLERQGLLPNQVFVATVVLDAAVTLLEN